MDLRDYEHIKFDLAEVLRTIELDSQLAARPGIAATGRDLSTHIHDLFSRLAEDRFNLVVFGRFSRGKSSLMNAMLGMDRLPTGVIPLTSVITTVAYGSDERVVLFFHSSGLFSDIPLSQLAENITERGNPGNMKGIRTAEVQLPAEILRRGFHFIDTPGLGSSIVANTRTTENFLGEADAFVLVTSYDSPLSEDELRVLDTIRLSGKRVFVVVNKHDSVRQTDREQVDEHLRQQLHTVFDKTAPIPFSMSATQALTARLSGDVQALEASGLPNFERALVAFLLDDRQREFLRNTWDRIADIVNAMPAADKAWQDLARLRDGIVGQTGGETAEATGDRGAGLAPDLTECTICKSVTDDVFGRWCTSMV